MTTIVYQRSFIADLDGNPLDSGKLYIGTANADPELFPVQCYWDTALTVPATQPITVSAGYPVNTGSRAAIYVGADSYSLRARNRSDVQVDYIASASLGSNLVSFLQSGTGAVSRTVQAKLRDTVNAQDFGAVGDNSTNDAAAIIAALAAHGQVHLPKTASNSYKIGSTIALTGNQSLTSDPGVTLYYTGSTGAAITLTGDSNVVDLGQVVAPLAPYCVKYYNLQWSRFRVRRIGQCTAAVFYHDGDAATANGGVNHWEVGDLQAGSVPYGVYLKESATYTLEGEIWEINCILSATTAAMRIGTAATSHKIRWNTYRIGIDAQAVTPILLDIYQDENNFELINWAGQTSPAVAHVRFDSGCGGNVLNAGPGIQDPLVVLDNSGLNLIQAQGQAGQRYFYGQTDTIKSNSTGTDIATFENISSANVTTKYAALKLRGRDTTNSGKDVASLRVTPQDSDWVNSTTTVYGRNADALVGYAFFGINGTPEGQIAAPIGAVATRRDGGVSTTFYVKQSGTGNTGWVAK